MFCHNRLSYIYKVCDLLADISVQLHKLWPDRVVMAQPWGENDTEHKAERDAHRPEVIESHDEIYAAIVAGDTTAAKLAMEQHIQDIIDNRMSSLAHSENGVPARQLTDEELAYSL